MDKKLLTAPCGLDCFNCPTYEDNITEERKKWVSEYFKIPIEETPCKGCRENNGVCKVTKDNRCATWDCIQKKGVNFCYECDNFPCNMLMPTFKGADLPHNLKIYNLCRIKIIGIDNWIEESSKIRELYYNGKFEVGLGPILE